MARMMTLAANFIVLSVFVWLRNIAVTSGFLVSNRLLSHGSAENSLLLSAKQSSEQALKEEIERKNIIKEDGKYAILDGHIDSTTVLPSVSEKQKTLLQGEVTRALKTRAYPLFMLEKLMQGVESSLDQLKSFSDEGIEGPGFGTDVKERIVILGTGWGAAALLKEIDVEKFDVTVISPRNYFLFTPMLAGAAVGTVDFRSITEPVRQINPHANYIEATATAVDPKTSVVTCESVACMGNSCSIEEFTVPYDRLVVAVGAQTNTFGIPGASLLTTVLVAVFPVPIHYNLSHTCLLFVKLLRCRCAGALLLFKANRRQSTNS